MGLDKVWYSKDSGVTNNSLSSPYDIDTTDYTAGKFDLYVWANDTSGNVNESRFTFTIGSNYIGEVRNV